MGCQHSMHIWKPNLCMLDFYVAARSQIFFLDAVIKLLMLIWVYMCLWHFRELFSFVKLSLFPDFGEFCWWTSWKEKIDHFLFELLYISTSKSVLHTLFFGWKMILCLVLIRQRGKRRHLWSEWLQRKVHIRNKSIDESWKGVITWRPHSSLS